jgi:hypothetical protein
MNFIPFRHPRRGDGSLAPLSDEEKAAQLRPELERKRQSAEEKRRLRELDEAIDRDIQAEREAAEQPPPDPLSALKADLAADKAARDAVAEGDIPPLVTGAAIWADDKRRRRHERERKELGHRERRAGLPQRLAKWERANGEIDAKRTASEAQASAAYDDALLLIRENAEREREVLGPRPSLESLEAV